MAERDPIELHTRYDRQEVAPPSELPDARRRKRRRTVIVALAAAKLALAGGAWLLIDHNHVSTDNAYVNADSAQVTPLVSGAVAAVPVVNTQSVREGDILLRLDDSDARLALAKAEAEYLKARRQFAQSKSTSGSLAAQGGARGADIGPAQAHIAVAEAREVAAHRAAIDAVAGDRGPAR